MLAREVQDEIGRRVADRYQLESVAGSGGMARVWRATDLSVGAGRTVALKRMLDMVARDPGLSGMFADEAWISRRIEHPNVVRGLDHGADALGPYLTLEWIDGIAASQLIAHRGCALGTGAWLSLGTDLLAGLSAVHAPSVRVIHRDIAPANVLIGADGVARLADFGVARALLRSRAQTPGSAMGKLGYLPPEVLRGGIHGTRGDLYGIGAVLWETLAGRRLFAGTRSKVELIKAYLGAPRPLLRTVHREVPAVVADVVDRALSVSPDERFESAAAMLQALQDAARFAGIAPNPEELAVAVWSARREARRTSLVPAAPRGQA